MGLDASGWSIRPSARTVLGGVGSLRSAWNEVVQLNQHRVSEPSGHLPSTQSRPTTTIETTPPPGLSTIERERSDEPGTVHQGRFQYTTELKSVTSIDRSTSRMYDPYVGTGFTRRRFLMVCGLGAVASSSPLKGFAARAAASDGFPIGAGHLIQPRDTWGANLQPTAPMTLEAPEDVRFLLVHHSASPNNYSLDQTIQYLRSFYHYHTSPQKGWHDIAYNFLVDRYGQIFEGRKDSIESPVRGDATGGSQGYALLCCFVGDHTNTAPTAEALSAMVALLAWLAGTYNIDPSPGATTEFVSRGSNLHQEGKLVTTPTITGHRTMSRTTCPGDQAFALVEHIFPTQVRDALATTSSTVSAATTNEPATVVTTSAPATTPPTTTPPTTAVQKEPSPNTTRQQSVPDTVPETTTTTQVTSTSPTTNPPETAEPDPLPTTSTLPPQETVSESHTILSVAPEDPGSSRQRSLLSYWPIASMSLGISTLVAVAVIQRRITNPGQGSPRDNKTH